MKTTTWEQRERIRSRLWRLVDDVREAMPHLDHAALTAIEGMITEAILPLEEIDRPLTEEAETAKTTELKKAISLLETLQRGRRSGLVNTNVFTPLVARTARRVERLAKQLTARAKP